MCANKVMLDSRVYGLSFVFITHKVCAIADGHNL